MDLAGKKVLVVGLGASGVAACKLCLAHGAVVRAADASPTPPSAEGLRSLGCELSLGGHSDQDFTWAELVVLSPGVDHRLGEVRAALKAGAQVIGELELGWRFLKHPAVMITGTNGKSTVTTLIGRMLERAGKQVFLGGNLGSPLCEAVIGEQGFDIAVLEVSSFQTDTATSLAPKVVVVLNITPDHLDRYDSFEDYAASKMSLVSRQGPGDVAVLCFDDPEVLARAGQASGAVWPYQVLEQPPSESVDTRGVAVGHDLSLYQGGKTAWQLTTERSKMPGAFNRANVLAAAMAAYALGAGAQAMQQAIDDFPGLAHRVQWVANIGGVDYYDDSKGTNVGAVIAAVEALERPQVLLLGGRDKDGRFDALAPVLNSLVKLVICFGEAGADIAGQIQGLGAEVEAVEDMAAAVALATQQSRAGDGVLLSPGCASFDAYGSYAQRGEHFQDLVKEAAK